MNRTIFGRIDKVILSKDYIRFKLTGNIHTDLTDASGTLLLDNRTGAWNGEIAEALGLPLALSTRSCLVDPSRRAIFWMTSPGRSAYPPVCDCRLLRALAMVFPLRWDSGSFDLANLA